MKIEQLLINSGHKNLLPLQDATINAFRENDNVRLLAQTGSGKTLAFILATLQHLDSDQKGVQAIIVTPTRELTLQVAEVYKSLRSGFTSTTCYGGHPVRIEKNELSANPSVIIATPGRLLDHLNREHIDLSECQHVVIDEFDKCLEFGFEKEMEAIRDYLPTPLKTLFVSATEIDYVPSAWNVDAPKTLQFESGKKPQGLKLWSVNCEDIFDGLAACLNTFKREQSVVFCNYREVVDDVAERLTELGISCIAYHGGMDQKEREMALIKYRNASFHALVCTDLGSRGLDIEDVEHVVHYQFPENESAFTHRNGRTARAEKQGNAYILHKSTHDLPEYLALPEKEFSPNWKAEPLKSEWTTLYFGAGKKDKLRKLDIVGFLSQQGKLKPDQIGKIELLDNMAFAAINSKALKYTLDNIHMKRIKGKRFVIKIAK